LIYYGSSISPNLTETEEGYLIALNVPIARTGIQKYLPKEVPIEDAEDYAGADGLIPVHREPEEVFSAATIASFEGKPATEGHPPDSVDTSNESYYRKGHMQNIRHGTGDESENLVADIFITDPLLKETIKSKAKREVSSGYACDWVVENGKVYQRNIRGNHIAVVPKGRAGSSVAIKDEQPPQAGKRRKIMAEKSLWQRVFGMGLKEFAKDAEPEELAAAAKLGMEAPQEPVKEADPLEKILAAIQGIDARLTALEQSDEKVHATLPGGDAMDELNKEIEAEAKKEDEPEKEEEKEKSSTIGDATDCLTKDSAVKLVESLKPAVAAMPQGRARDEAIEGLRSLLKVPAGNVYGQISKAVASHKTADANPTPTLADNNKTFVENCEKLRNKEDK